MVRRSESLKVKDPTRCQITYCRKKNTLIKNCKKISDSFDIDLAFIAYSPTGFVSPYSSRLKMEDVIRRYLDLPPDKRYFYLDGVQVEKLEQLDHIWGDENKLCYLNTQIKLLELEIQKATLEKESLNNKLRSFEVGLDEEPTISKLTWLEKNLGASLEQVKERKNQLWKERSFKIQSTAGMTQTWRNPCATQHQVQHGLSGYRVRGGVTKYQDLPGLVNQTLASTSNGYMGNLPVTATVPCGGHLGLNSCLIPGAQFLPVNYSSMQGNTVHRAPIWVQNRQTRQTSSYNWNNLQTQNIGASTSQFQVNTMVNGRCGNMPPNPNLSSATLPLRSDSGTVFSSGYTPITPSGFTIANTVNNNRRCEQQFTNNTPAAATTVTNGNNNGDCKPVPNHVTSTITASVTANQICGNNNGSFEPVPTSQVNRLLGDCTIDEILEYCSSIDEIPSELNLSDDQENLGNENMVAPAFQMQVNRNGVINNCADNNATQTPNVNNFTLPSSSDIGISSINGYELEDPTFTSDNGGFEPYHSLVNPPPTRGLLDNQGGIKGILEGDSFKLDDFQWLEDFDY